MKYLLFVLSGIFSWAFASAQFHYTGSVKHAHNDYEHRQPFADAYALGFESIEADIYLQDNTLLVAHEASELNKERTLEALYLQPIEKILTSSNGEIYPGTQKDLQLLIDVKTEATATLSRLLEILKKYPAITAAKNVRIVISGNRPAEESYVKYPDYIFFDGRPGVEYTPAQLEKVAMISESYYRYSLWKGKGDISAAERSKLQQMAAQVAALHKPSRLWGTPDTPEAWKLFAELGFTFINTDSIAKLATWLPDYQYGKLTLHDSTTTLMPFNRTLKSAGTVVRYGNPALENHALDLAVLAGTTLAAVEDRYGIAIIDYTTKKLVHRFAYEDSLAYKNLVSTYSGIKTFSDGGQWITWSAADRDNGKGILFVAQYQNGITNIRKLAIPAKAPARSAIPNEILVSRQGSQIFLYLVLNGNNELVKLSWPGLRTIWTVPTGVAPYGIAQAGKKLYITNWAGNTVTDTSRDHAGTPWGSAYTNTVTGATASGSVWVLDAETGRLLKQIGVGLHPNAITASAKGQYIYLTNGSSDAVSVIATATDKLIEIIPTGLFSKSDNKQGSTPNALFLDQASNRLFVSNGLDNAVAVVQLKKNAAGQHAGKSVVTGFIPTEAYPAGLLLAGKTLVVANLEGDGANVIDRQKGARSIHQQLASVSMIPLPATGDLKSLTLQVYRQNLQHRMAAASQPARSGMQPVPVPERIGEPSVFKHVVYIIKENKTYDQVFGDLPAGRGDSSLCVFGRRITPNMHALAMQFGSMDNYYASGKSSAEGHQWTDAGMVSDYVEKNVRAWLRSYPHRQDDALVYNSTGFIWNHAKSHGKWVRIFGEACTTQYDRALSWSDLYQHYTSHKAPNWHNTTTIAPIRGMISPTYPDCDNLHFTDQQRADIFLKEWEAYEKQNQLPDLLILSLPNDHTAGTSPEWPTPDAMVADNDLATGRIIERITQSKFWDSTVVFITEDDSQGGWDHISAYRTVGLVLSKYAPRQVVTTNYNQTSMLRTIEQILGLPPMHIIDATASPMFDCFGSQPAPLTYTALPANIPLNQMNEPLKSLNGRARKYALQSQNEVFNEVDGGEDDTMNRILWFYKMGDKPYGQGR